MPSSATVCFVLAAVYCIANILVVRKSTRWSNQMWAGGSSNGRTRIMFKSFRMLLSVGLLVRLLLCCFRHFTASRVCQDVQSICIPKPLNAFWQSLHIFTLCSAMPSSATVCFVLAAIYCIANILVVRKSTRWSNQMWAGGSSNGRTRIMFKSFWDASVSRSSGCGCCCVIFSIFPNRFAAGVAIWQKSRSTNRNRLLSTSVHGDSCGPCRWHITACYLPDRSSHWFNTWIDAVWIGLAFHLVRASNACQSRYAVSCGTQHEAARNLAEIAVNEQEPLVEHFCARWFLRAVSVTHHSLLPTRQI